MNSTIHLQPSNNNCSPPASATKREENRRWRPTKHLDRSKLAFRQLLIPIILTRWVIYKLSLLWGVRPRHNTCRLWQNSREKCRWFKKKNTESSSTGKKNCSATLKAAMTRPRKEGHTHLLLKLCCLALTLWESNRAIKRMTSTCQKLSTTKIKGKSWERSHVLVMGMLPWFTRNWW